MNRNLTALTKAELRRWEIPVLAHHLVKIEPETARDWAWAAVDTPRSKEIMVLFESLFP